MKIVNLKTYRVLRQRQAQEMAYRHKITQMEKHELLQELLNYHEAYQRDPHDISITLRGQHLMEVLEERSELNELKDLSREFQNKLRVRLYGQIEQLTKTPSV